jgi:CO dehydrogenase nickel-insertion accessory protein CooC1
MDYSNQEILSEAKVWFDCYTGNFARCFLDRDRENAYKAWVVFADLALGIHFEDGTKENVDTFINAFMNSSKDLNVSMQQVSEGLKEFDEILELIY